MTSRFPVLKGLDQQLYDFVVFLVEILIEGAEGAHIERVIHQPDDPYAGFSLPQSGFTGFCPPEKVLAKLGLKGGCSASRIG